MIICCYTIHICVHCDKVLTAGVSGETSGAYYDQPNFSLLAIMAFLAACETAPKDAGDTAGSGASSRQVAHRLLLKVLPRVLPQVMLAA